MLHPYDRCMCITSLYVLLAASYVKVPYMCSAMVATTLASILHWLHYDNKVFHLADNVLSAGVFIWNGCVLFFSWSEQSPYAAASAATSMLLFQTRVGFREKALQKYRLVYVLPHTGFRFFAFWFVMLSHGQAWSARLSLCYWLSVLLFS